ncbi:MAG: RdgB/HAM1 family non-canonical purine NTP pyrophosphatase [Thermoguttaceae bacterium]|nr:RdgB/HAM1 family non-canonical purine NTP pyrophosphatase [Thermoguttaceae bacterium]
MSNPTILLGSGNRNKGIEIARLLTPTGIKMTTLAEMPPAPEVVEDGATFAENAAKKASEYARHFRMWTVAEDSGLSVDALDGAPGIYSSRFSGAEHSDEKNNDLLLEKLRGVPLEKRAAHYTCSMAFSDPDGEIRFTCEEYCRGRILFERHGTNGFGYDPLFEVIEYHRSFGDLSPLLKSVISHRARAIRRFIAAAPRYLSDRT